jgi:hypothetical protein
MSFLSDIGHAVSSTVSSVVNTAEDVVGTVVKAGEGAVEGAVGDVIKNPLDIFNPFAVLSGAVSGAVQNVEGNSSSSSSNLTSVLKSPFTDISKFFTNSSDDLGDLGGSSVTAVLLKLAEKERGQLADKVNQLKNLQVPGQGATPQQQADYDSAKVNLMADIQSIQNSIQQITTMATNVEKTDSDINMSIARNLA